MNIYLFFSCENNYVQFSTFADTSEKYCGTLQPRESYSYQSCSNEVKISYSTLGNNVEAYRGFRVYYECKNNFASF